jgi:hypothetical protein
MEVIGRKLCFIDIAAGTSPQKQDVTLLSLYAVADLAIFREAVSA